MEINVSWRQEPRPQSAGALLARWSHPLLPAQVFTGICHPLEPGSPGQGLVGCQRGLLQVDDGEGLEQVLQGMGGPR